MNKKAEGIISATAGRFSEFAGAAVLVAGALAFAGSAFDFPILRSGLAGLPPTASGAALAFVLSGASLLLFQAGKARTGQAAALGVIAIAMVALSDVSSGADLAGRTSIHTAFNFLLLGPALLLIGWKPRRGAWLLDVLVGLPVEVAMLGFIGYACRVPAFYGWNSLFPDTAMSLPSVLCFIVLGIGILWARPHGSLMTVVHSATAGGVAARRLLLIPVLVPLTLGLLQNFARTTEYFNQEVSGWLFSIANVVCFTCVIWWISTMLYRKDSERQVAERHVQEMNAALEQRVAERTAESEQARERLRAVIETALDAVITIDSKGTIVRWNRQAEAIFGWTAGEALGRKLSETIIPERFREAHERGIERFAATGKSTLLSRRFEMPGLRRDGSEFPVELAITPMLVGGETLFGAYLRDITERKNSEQKVAWLASFPEQNPNPVVEFDAAAGTVRYMNPTASRLFPGLPDAGLSHPWLMGLDEVAAPLLYGQLPGPVSREVQVGDQCYAQTIGFIPGTGQLRIYSIDITSRLRAEHDLARERNILRTLIDNLPDFVYMKDAEGRFIVNNAANVRALGAVHERETLGKTVFDFFARDVAQVFAADDREVIQAGQPIFKREHPGRDGRTVITTKLPLRDDAGAVNAVLGITEDITERKQAERDLRESREHYRALADSLPNLIWTCNADGVCDYLSQQWLGYTGRSVEEQLGLGWLESVHPDDRARVQSEWSAAQGRRSQFEDEFRLRRADGAYRWFKTMAVPLYGEGGRVTKWFGSNTDVHDSKRAREKLQSQLQRLNLLDQITRAIAERHDLRSIFQVVLRTLEDNLPMEFGCVLLYEAPAAKLVVTCMGLQSAPWAQTLLLSEEARVDVDENGLAHCLSGRLVYEPDLAEVNFPFPRRLFGAGLRSTVFAPLRVESDVFGILVTARRNPGGFSSQDCEFLRQVSEHVGLAAHQMKIHEALKAAYEELNQTQQAAMQQERLRALGQMASGIAHDINNAISPVALYTEALLEREPNLSDRARSYLKTTQRAIDDVAQTIGRMREFYRPREIQSALLPVNLNVLVAQVIDLTRAKWSDMPQQKGAVVNTVAELDPNLPSIEGIESEIREALTNLVFNAVDAMPDGGDLTFRTRRDAGYVRVEVVDSGLGMDEETRNRCLEPFFTTKGERGTGLGLPMVYGVMRRHSADIDIESVPGHGTTVRLSFPLPVVTTAEPVEPLSPIATISSLRILAIDDDPLIVQSLRDAFEADGHTVVPANGGQEGIDLFRAAEAERQPFSVVFTDLGMPYVDGRQVAAAVKGLRPKVPVIMLTGWGRRLLADGDIPAHVDRVLSKPPSLRDLRAALADLLGQARAAM